MAAKVSKADQIRALGKAGHSTRAIAELVYGLSPDASYAERSKKMAYIRVVLRQRVDGWSQNDINHAVKKFGSMKSYYDDRNAKTKDYRDAYYRKRREDPLYRFAQARAKRILRLRKRLEAAANITLTVNKM